MNPSTPQTQGNKPQQLLKQLGGFSKPKYPSAASRSPGEPRPDKQNVPDSITMDSVIRDSILNNVPKTYPYWKPGTGDVNPVPTMVGDPRMHLNIGIGGTSKYSVSPLDVGTYSQWGQTAIPNTQSSIMPDPTSAQLSLLKNTFAKNAKNQTPSYLPLPNANTITTPYPVSPLVKTKEAIPFVKNTNGKITTTTSLQDQVHQNVLIPIQYKGKTTLISVPRDPNSDPNNPDNNLYSDYYNGQRQLFFKHSTKSIEPIFKTTKDRVKAGLIHPGDSGLKGALYGA